ncbi:MAG: hypothetical protein K0S65_1728, partial [Labilithrix sp.]|nr:hypothetical protein [Labilithrix sp.]
IDAVAGQMGSSLRADRDRDVANFAGNVLRSAIPAALQLTRYGDAVNAPTGIDLSAPFKQNQELLRATETFLRSVGQLRLKMEHAYRYEIAAFQEASPDSQAGFNLMPPAPPKRYSFELRPIASQWAERFRTDDGLNIGTETAKVQQAISRCVDNAKLGDFSDCQPAVDPLTLPVHQEGSRALAEYLATARIVRMRGFVMKNAGEQSYALAEPTCNADAFASRLPTAEEAIFLAPLVAGAGGGMRKSIWTAATDSCSSATGGMPYYENPLTGVSKQGCDAWGFFAQGARAIVCVPQSGPIGKREDL